MPPTRSRETSPAVRLWTGSRLVLAVLGLTIPAVAQPAPVTPPRQPPRLLFIALDAVPFRVAKEVLDGTAGEPPVLRGFSAPAALVSSFPSTTTPALTGILEPFGVEAAPGYEAHFFDRERNKVRGGKSFSYLSIDFAWRDFFDYRRKSIIMRGVKKLTPIRASTEELEKGLERFARSDLPVFFIYSASSDTAGHLRSPESVHAVLRTLDRLLSELRAARPELEFHTVVLSDHGMAGGEPMTNIARDLRRALGEAGWKVRERLERPEDVVFAPYGLVSSFEIFTLPGRERTAAATLARVPGVDLCITPDEDGVRVFGRRGDARVHRRVEGGRVLWRYEPLNGDPLGYLEVVARLRQRSRGAGDWFPDDWWFDSTWRTDYPDAFHRAMRSFDLVRNRASAVCSLAGGYMHGGRLTEIGAALSIGELKWTHGALSREATLGFITTDHPAWRPRPAVRFDDSLKPFRELVSASPAGDLVAARR